LADTLSVKCDFGPKNFEQDEKVKKQLKYPLKLRGHYSFFSCACYTTCSIACARKKTLSHMAILFLQCSQKHSMEH